MNTPNTESLIESAAGLTLDFTRTPLATVLTSQKANGELDARADKLKAAIGAMFSGEVMNTTEQRPVMHVALRDVESPSTSFAEQAQPVCQRMMQTAELIRSGAVSYTHLRAHET